MSMRPRATFLALTTAVALAAAAALAGAGATAAAATTPEHLSVSWDAPNGSTFTLPSTDGFGDSVRLEISSNNEGNASVTTHRTSGHGGTLFIGSASYTLASSGSSYVADPPFGDTGLTAGEWLVTVKLNGVTKTTHLKIGTGVATSVKVTTTPSKVFVNSSTGAHALVPHVTAKDEVGTSLPILSGTLKYADSHGANTATGAISSAGATTPGAGGTLFDIGGNHSGAATLKVSNVQGPTTSTHPPSATTHPVLSVAKLTGLTITPTYKTLYPNATGTKATETITIDIATNVGATLPLESGIATIRKGTTLVQSQGLSTTAEDVQTWNGLYGVNVVPGTYTVAVTATLVDGNTLTKSIHLVVSSAVPVLRTKTVTYAGSVFTKSTLHGNAKCMVSGSALACVSKTGEAEHPYVIKSVPSSVLALAPELGYSATMSVSVSHFAATGGTAYFIWGSANLPYSDTIPIDGNGGFADGPELAENTATKVSLDPSWQGAVTWDLTKFSVTYFYWAAP